MELLERLVADDEERTELLDCSALSALLELLDFALLELLDETLLELLDFALLELLNEGMPELLSGMLYELSISLDEDSSENENSSELDVSAPPMTIAPPVLSPSQAHRMKDTKNKRQIFFILSNIIFFFHVRKKMRPNGRIIFLREN
jgi:hypothetical protein